MEESGKGLNYERSEELIKRYGGFMEVASELEDLGKFRFASELRSVAMAKPYFGAVEGRYYAVNLTDAVGGN